MLKTLKYIALSLAVVLAGMNAGAKKLPGIPPVDVSVQDGGRPCAWRGIPHGVALRELDNRDLNPMSGSLVQPDGIIDFRPGRLSGLNSAAGAAAIVRMLPKCKIPGGSNLCGFVAYNELGLDLGVYRLPIAGSQKLDMLRGTAGLLSSFRGGAASDRYYVMSYYGTTVQNGVDQCLTAIFDKSDWSLVAETGDYGHYERICSDMTYDPVTDRFYGCFLDRGQSRWLLGYMQVDPSSPAATIASVTGLSTLETSLNGIAADADGVLWGIRNDNGDLVTVNKKTGAMTTVASTGFVPAYNGSLAWDTANGILYWSVTYDDSAAPSGKSSAILAVDKATGALRHVYDFTAPAQTCGLYAEFTPSGSAPGAFSAFDVAFAGESLSGTLSFDAPAALADGSAASGTLDYTVSVVKDNGYVAHHGEYSCRYGQTGITLPVTLKTPGYYTFTVRGHNDAGSSYPESLSRYVGSDLPEIPRNIGVHYSAGVVSVTWDAVTSTVHGGYFDPDDVSYHVTLTQVDADGNKIALPAVVATGTQASWQVENSDALRGFQASVTAVFGSNRGETASGPYVWFGYLEAPFVQAMTAQTDGWTPVTPDKGSSWQKVFSGDGKGWAIPYIWGSVNDAWLFSPAIMLEEGKYYALSFQSWSTVVNQSLQVWIGRSPAIESMDGKLVDVSVPGNTKPSSARTTTFGFECRQSGIYHLGFHNNTRSDTYTNKPYMWIGNVSCEKAPDTAPAAPLLDIDYDRTGKLMAHITITAPAATYGNTALSSIDRLTLQSNGTLVNEWKDVTPGSVLNFDFEGAKAGNYTFIAEAEVDGVRGVPAIETAYLGMSKPVDPDWVDVVEKAEAPGTVEITWAPVSLVANGQEIAAEAVSYNVMNILSNSYIERNVTAQPYVYKACEPDGQTALCVAVNAETSAGVSSTYGTTANQSIMHVGTPYTLPFRETFGGGSVRYSWSVVNQHSSYDRVSVIDTRANLGNADANGDGYCLQAFVPYENSSASLYSGVIDIPADAHNPVIGFAVYRPYYEGHDDNDNAVEVSILGSKNQGSLAPVRAGAQGYGWKYYYYDLSLFKGQRVNLMFTFQTRSFTSHYIDDIHFFDAPERDLALTTISAPGQVDPGRQLQVSVNVVNLGTSRLDRNTARVELRRGVDNTLVMTRDLPALAPFQSTAIVLDDKLNNSFDRQVGYKAVLVCDGDSDDSNNSIGVSVNLNLPAMPAPRSLAGERNEDGFAALSWDAPDLTPVYPVAEVGFETSVEPSMTALEGFTSIDVDGNEVYGELGLAGPCGFISFPHSSLARSGNWMIVSPCNEGGAPKEDWLVSPKLSGSAQTISFYARTNWNAYESFKVLASSGGPEMADFATTLLEKTTTSNDWQRVDIDLPEGTLYFAIVSKAEDTSDLVYLMLDDFMFEAADTNEGLVVEGYNAYRDNMVVGRLSAIESWEDVAGNAGPHFYRVTARYDGRGESGPSNELFLFTRGSGIDSAVAMTGKVYTIPGNIVIEGAGGCTLSVADIKGVVIRSPGEASGFESIPAVPGHYIVTIDGASVKVCVR